MDERTLQALSKALTLMMFPGNIIEDSHLDGVCWDADTMMRL
jgi:hypothetical protein